VENGEHEEEWTGNAPAQVSAEPRPMVTVGVVEDDPVLRECLGQMVSEVPNFQLIGLAASIAEGFGLLDAAPDVLLVDLALPDGNGLDLIARARSTNSATRMLVLTVFADVRSVVTAIEEGADGYLLKEASVDQIASSINVVLAGGAPISPAVAGHILARMRKTTEQKPIAQLTSLTAKELVILESLASGKALKEVAAKQGISVHTVGDHVKAIYRKLSANSRGEAIYKAVQAGIIRLDEHKDHQPR
jgi:DNA-binding NarL/FixJ family response regulator